jgi:NADH dehydrogenase [ubiquinone] 1 alpha subcomplex assembly factor 5
VSEENLKRSKERIDAVRADKNYTNLPENIFGVLINHDKWPFKDNSVDCVINNLYLHNTDSLEELFKRYQRSLIPDGCLIGNVYTQYSFSELKTIMALAEGEREGGVSPNVVTFPTMQDMGQLLTKTGYNLPSISITENRLYFDDLVDIFEFLKTTGELNFLSNRRVFKSHDTYIAAIALYQHIFNKYREDTEFTLNPLKKVSKVKLTDKEDFVYLTLEITSFIAWKYHESQQKPKARGSAELNLKDLAFKTIEEGDDPTLRIGRIKPTENDEYEIEELTEKIKQKIIEKVGKEAVEEKLESKNK